MRAVKVKGLSDMMGPMGPWMMMIWLVIAVVVLSLAVAGGIWLTRSLRDRDRDGPPEVTQGSDPAQEELRRRYAAGEISREEYLQRKIDLEP